MGGKCIVRSFYFFSRHIASVFFFIGFESTQLARQLHQERTQMEVSFFLSLLGRRPNLITRLFLFFCFESTLLARQVQQERAQVEVQ
jgi:hypothetical protein